jgi:hypothetical protein
MKIHPVEAELFLADGRTERHRHDEANSRFSHFANAPKNAGFNKTSPCTIKEHCEQLSRNENEIRLH